MSLERLDTWIQNFTTPEELYFGAKILDSLIYRSHSQTVSMMRQMFQRVIPDLARRNRMSRSLTRIYDSLRSDQDSGIRIVPVIPEYDSPGKSGPIIARMLRRNLEFNDDWMIYPHTIESQTTSASDFIFVDDFLGTGSQFDEFAEFIDLKRLAESCTFIYAPLTAHIDGIRYLATKYPQIVVDTVDCLDESHGLFFEDGGNFPDDTNSPEMAKRFYYDLMVSRGVDLSGSDRRGFGAFDLTYAFEHAIPDNTIPLLWWARSSNWSPLFER